MEYLRYAFVTAHKSHLYRILTRLTLFGVEMAVVVYYMPQSIYDTIGDRSGSKNSTNPSSELILWYSLAKYYTRSNADKDTSLGDTA